MRSRNIRKPRAKRRRTASISSRFRRGPLMSNLRASPRVIIRRKPPPRTFPPAPEQPMRSPRMPQIEDFPRPVQEQLRQARGEPSSADARRKSIFERLASFGASRTEEALQHAQPQPRSHAAPPAGAGYGRGPEPQPSPMHTEYAKRPSASALPPANPQAGLDQHGRRAPTPRSVEEDHLEIPAFLRRQANH